MTTTEDILAEYAEGFLTDTITAADIIAKYNIKPGSELEELLLLAEQLEQVLVKVVPSEEFVAGLREDLLMGNSDSLIKRLSLLSPSLSAKQVGSLAAGIGGLTVAAGLYWYARRAGFALRPRRDAESPALVS